MTKGKNIIVLLLVLSVFLMPVLAQEGSGKEKIEVTKVTDNIYKLFVYGYVNIYAFNGPDGVLLIDTGFKESAEKLKVTLKEAGMDNIKYIINTHMDGDHTGGNRVFGRDAVIIAHTVCRNRLSENPEFPKNGLPVITLEDVLTLHINSEKIKLISLTGSHTPEDIIIHFTNANIVCLGDIIIGESFPYLRTAQGISIEKLLENIDKILKMFREDVKIILSHGRDYTMQDLRKYREMLIKTTEIVSRAMKNGKNTEDMKKEDILKDWKSWNNKIHEFLNTDLWIDTVYECLLKKKNEY